jgi:hypothetical protein
MSIGMDPACDAEPLLTGAEANASGNQRTIGSDGTKQKTTKQAVCEETVRFPRFIPPHFHKARHPFLEKAKKNLNTKFYLSLLALCNLSYHDNKFLKDLSRRLIRKEFRSSLIEVLSALMQYMDKNNFKVGMMFNDGWKSWHAKDFINRINESRRIQGFDEMSYRVFWRNINFLEKIGYLNVHERKKYKNNKWRSKDATFSLNPQLFYDLGITEEDFAKSDKKEEYEIARHIREQKKNNFIKNSRQQQKIHRQRMKDIRKILKDSKSNKMVSYSDRQLLEKEYPGYDRRRPEAPQSYQDCTNISGYLSKIPLIKPPPS